MGAAADKSTEMQVVISDADESYNQRRNVTMMALTDMDSAMEPGTAAGSR